MWQACLREGAVRLSLLLLMLCLSALPFVASRQRASGYMCGMRLSLLQCALLSVRGSMWWAQLADRGLQCAPVDIAALCAVEVCTCGCAVVM